MEWSALQKLEGFLDKIGIDTANDSKVIMMILKMRIIHNGLFFHGKGTAP